MCVCACVACKAQAKPEEPKPISGDFSVARTCASRMFKGPNLSISPRRRPSFQWPNCILQAPRAPFCKKTDSISTPSASAELRGHPQGVRPQSICSRFPVQETWKLLGFFGFPSSKTPKSECLVKQLISCRLLLTEYKTGFPKRFFSPQSCRSN